MSTKINPVLRARQFIANNKLLVGATGIGITMISLPLIQLLSLQNNNSPQAKLQEESLWKQFWITLTSAIGGGVLAGILAWKLGPGTIEKFFRNNFINYP